MSHGTEVHSFKSQLKIQVATHPSFPADVLAMTHKTRLVMYPDKTQCLLIVDLRDNTKAALTVEGCYVNSVTRLQEHICPILMNSVFLFGVGRNGHEAGRCLI